jgi:tetratricopeptide (TPR) repeat protein
VNLERTSAIGLVLTLGVLLSLAGPGHPKDGAAAHHAAAYSEPPDLLKLRLDGNDLFRAGNTVAAIRIYERGESDARLRGEARSELKFLNNLGSARYQLSQYRDAVKAYLRARALAISQGDQETLAAIYFNLSSVYFQMGEEDATSASAERGLELPLTASARYRSKLLIQSALIKVRAKNYREAVPQLRQAVDVARAQLDTATEAQAWNELGNALLECDQQPAAENALLESYRLRKLNRDRRLHFSYESLAELRVAQDHPAAALPFLDRALDSAAALGPGALWRPLFTRGKVKLALSQTRDAYDDLQTALRYLRDWSAEVLPADPFRVSAEVELHGVYSAFIEAAGRLYRETGQRRYAEASFAAAEEGRAASLRMLWRGSALPQQLPDEYWRTVAQLQRAASEQIQHDSDGGNVGRLRGRLAEMQAAAGLDQVPAPEDNLPAGGGLLQATRSALGADEGFFGFYTGQAESWLWVVTRRGFEMVSLPSEDRLAQDVGSFVAALRNRVEDAPVLGRQLFRELFGRVNPEILRTSTWTVAADGPLFEAPFSALVEEDASRSGRPQYLIERHSLRMTTGVPALARRAPRSAQEKFVGVGDPIYNRADPRLPGEARKSEASIFNPFTQRTVAAAMELPRLPGSAREVEACAAVWRVHGLPAALLEGVSATKQAIAESLRAQPAVLHVAAHMLFPRDDESGGMLALSLQSGSRVDLLSDIETAGLPAKVGLVVLNGCSSGRGRVLPGAGLMGMTRAWLAAGARSVIATRWPAPDRDAGTIFPSLYGLYLRRRASDSVSFGALLRDAQLTELHAGGARADPARWASYFCVERD